MEIEIIKFLQTGAGGFFDIVFTIFSFLGSYPGFFATLIVLFILNKKYGVAFGITYGAGIGFNYILKVIINRPRPFEVDPSIINSLPTIGQSMPSSHTMAAVMISVFALYFIFKKSKTKFVKILSCITFSLFIMLVGISRMYLGQHYPTDVLVGFFNGILFALCGILLYNLIGSTIEKWREGKREKYEDNNKK